MDSFSNNLARTLKSTLDDWIRDETDRLARGISVSDYAMYMNRVGEIKGLRRALDLIEVTEKKLGRPEEAPTPPVVKRSYET